MFCPQPPKGGFAPLLIAPLLRLRVAASAEQGRGDGGLNTQSNKVQYENKNFNIYPTLLSDLNSSGDFLAGDNT